jgi:hypothetical protein
MWLILLMLLLLIACFATFWALVVFSQNIIGVGAPVEEEIPAAPDAPPSAG